MLNFNYIYIHTYMHTYIHKLYYKMAESILFDDETLLPLPNGVSVSASKTCQCGTGEGTTFNFFANFHCKGQKVEVALTYYIKSETRVFKNAIVNCKIFSTLEEARTCITTYFA